MDHDDSYRRADQEGAYRAEELLYKSEESGLKLSNNLVNHPPFISSENMRWLFSHKSFVIGGLAFMCGWCVAYNPKLTRILIVIIFC